MTRVEQRGQLRFVEVTFTSTELAGHLWQLASGRQPPLHPTRISLNQPELLFLGADMLAGTIEDPKRQERVVWLLTDGERLYHGKEIYVLGKLGGAPLPEEPPPGQKIIGTMHTQYGSGLPSPVDIATVATHKSAFLNIVLGTNLEVCFLLATRPQRPPRKEAERINAKAWVLSNMVEQVPLDRRAYLSILEEFSSPLGVLLYTETHGIIGL